MNKLSYRIFSATTACSLVYVTSILVFIHVTDAEFDGKDPKTVFDLGINLSKRLSDSPSGTKEDIINDLTDYFIYLNTAFRVEGDPLGKEVLQKLKVRGGPPFLALEVDKGMLERKYDMGVVEVDHVKEVIEDIDRLWKDIKKGILVSPEFENY